MFANIHDLMTESGHVTSINALERNLKYMIFKELLVLKNIFECILYLTIVLKTFPTIVNIAIDYLLLEQSV